MILLFNWRSLRVAQSNQWKYCASNCRNPLSAKIFKTADFASVCISHLTLTMGCLTKSSSLPQSTRVLIFCYGHATQHDGLVKFLWDSSTQNKYFHRIVFAFSALARQPLLWYGHVCDKDSLANIKSVTSILLLIIIHSRRVLCCQIFENLEPNICSQPLWTFTSIEVGRKPYYLVTLNVIVTR